MSRSARSVYVVREYIVGNVLIMSITARSDAHDVCALFVAVFTSELMHESRRWTPNPVPDEQCFEAIKAGIDLMPDGVKMVLNSCASASPLIDVPCVVY